MTQVIHIPKIRRRFIAAVIDYSIIIVLNFYLIMILGEPLEGETNSYRLTGLPVLITLIPWGLLTVCLEYFFGATLGNSIVSIRPVPIQNPSAKITFIQSLKRHLLDPIDMFFFGLVGFLVMKSTQKKQRLGDIWANTIVIKYQRL